MKRLGALLLAAVGLLGCGKKLSPPPVDPASLFPPRTEFQSNQLAQVDGWLRGSLTNLDLSWVVDMGLPAIPTVARLASDETLSADARDLILIVLGRGLGKAQFREQPDARNNLIVPVILQALTNQELRVKRSAAFVARFVDDARLVPALRPLLAEKDFVQEQAVLALGTSGRDMEVLPIAKLFFETPNGTFRYSCLYALATMGLLHDVDVGAVLRQNAASFGEGNLQNAGSVGDRFVEFRKVAALFRLLSSPDAAQRERAIEALRKRTGREIAFDPNGEESSRRRAMEEWQKYLLGDYWLVPSPARSAE